MRAAQRWTAVTLGALVLSALPAVQALAVPGPSDPLPSQEQVDAARAAAGGKAAQVARVTAELAAVGARVEAAALALSQAAEEYNAARVELDRRTADAASAREVADAARAGLEIARHEVGTLASRQYRQGPTTTLEAWLDADGPDAVLERATLMGVVGDAQGSALARVSARRAVVASTQARASEALAAQEAAAEALEAARDVAEATERKARQVAGEVQARQVSLQAELVTLQAASAAVAAQRREGLAAQARAQAEAEARARAQAQARVAAEQRASRAAAAREAAGPAARPTAEPSTRPSDRPSSRPSTRPSSRPSTSPSTRPSQRPTPRPTSRPTPPREDPPPGSSSGSAAAGARALDWARSRIGLPYEWGGAGPGTYDCSGLTMRAWEQAGVYLPHSSRAQYKQVKKIAYGDLRPGDLLFYGTDPGDADSIYHVAIYAGGGSMVEAPRTGLDVRTTGVRTSNRMPYAGRP